jgi:tRNA(Ile)-lysidine synthase TilS/MesJ
MFFCKIERGEKIMSNLDFESFYEGSNEIEYHIRGVFPSRHEHETDPLLVSFTEEDVTKGKYCKKHTDFFLNGKCSFCVKESLMSMDFMEPQYIHYQQEPQETPAWKIVFRTLVGVALFSGWFLWLWG